MSYDNHATDQDKRRLLQQLTLMLGAGTLLVVSPPATADARHALEARPDDLLAQLSGSSVRGHLTTPKSPGYDVARQIYDRRTDKRPLAIAYCGGEAEVASVIRLAQNCNVPFAIRSGGHGFTGRSTIEGGLLVDLSRMNQVSIAEDRSTVTIQPGARTMQVIATTSSIGKAPVTPTDGHIGLTGAALFSGQGYLSRVHGNACDNVTMARVLLADGRIVSASPSENEDLFWAIRGAGDSFGVVLSLTMRLHDVPSHVGYCSVAYNIDNALDIMRRWRDHKWASPTPFPLGGFDLDPKTRTPRLSYLVMLLGDESENKRDLDILATYGKPIFTDIRKATWAEAHTALPLPMNKRFYIAGRETEKQDDRSMHLMLDMIHAATALPATNGDMTGPIVFFFPNDEGFAMEPASPTAYNCRGGFEIECLASWDNPAHDRQFENWAEASAASIANAGLVSKPPVIANTRFDVALTRQCFGKNYERLVRVKRKYDARGYFGATAAIEL